MKIAKRTIMPTVAGLGLTALLLSAHATQPLKIDFSDETVGAERKSFLSVVGIWRIESDGNNKVLVVDGRQWKQGQTAAGIADKARTLYGDRYAEFLDRVQAYAYFPYVVAKDVTDFRDGEISVRFEGISSRIDQGAGIVQPQAERRLSHRARKSSGEQSRLVEIRERQALLGEMDSQYADPNPPVARPQGAHRWAQGRGLSRRQALLGARPARAGFGTNWPVVQGRQPHVLRRLHRDAG